MVRTPLHKPTHPVRLVTASSLFDGHDAAINIMRRIFQAQGCEVIHLGHNRSVAEIVEAAIEEDVQGVAVSSYQGGHVEYFEYLVEQLRSRGAGHVKVVGGGGGVIVHDEIVRLRKSGVTIFSPEDGQRMGLPGMINSVVRDCDHDLWSLHGATADELMSGHRPALSRMITGIETGAVDDAALAQIRDGRGGACHPGARHHRHRRQRQELAHRRAGAATADGPARQGAGRRTRCRPDPTQGRRCAARRPDPDEQPRPRRARARPRPRLLPQPRDPRCARAARSPCRRHRRDQGCRLRPRGRRDARHRPGRRGRRTVRRHQPLCHDAGVRRRIPAREDRHARLRRRRGDQQVRATRREGRAARGLPPAGAQP